MFYWDMILVLRFLLIFICVVVWFHSGSLIFARNWPLGIWIPDWPMSSDKKKSGVHEIALIDFLYHSMSRNSRTVQVRNKYSRTEGLLCSCAAKGDSASLPGTEDFCGWCSFLGCYSSCICIPSLAKIYWILEEHTFRLRFCLSSVYLESVWISLFINQITFSEKNAVASIRGPCCWNICTIGRRLSAGKSVEKIHLMRQGYLRIGDNYPNTSLFIYFMLVNDFQSP